MMVSNSFWMTLSFTPVKQSNCVFVLLANSTIGLTTCSDCILSNGLSKIKNFQDISFANLAFLKWFKKEMNMEILAICLSPPLQSASILSQLAYSLFMANNSFLGFNTRILHFVTSA